MPSSLLACRNDVHSQGGEDGVIAEIFRRIGTSNRWCVEFGAWDGKHISNTYALVEQGWKAVYIEGDADKAVDLRRTAEEWPAQIVAIEAFVEPSGEGSLDSLLAQTEIPHDFDLLSIDVDGPDWHIWRGMSGYTPRVVVIEVNSTIPAWSTAVDGEGVTGSSFLATVELGRSKGYTAVCHTGNAILVRDDLVSLLALPDDLSSPQELYLTDEVIAPPPIASLVMRLKQALRRPRAA